MPPHLATKLGLDDVFQEVILRVIRNEAQFSLLDEGQRRAYVLKTFAAVLNDQIRYHDRAKRQVGIEGSLDGLGNRRGIPPEEWLAAELTSPSGRAAKRELLDRLAAALAALPPDQRRAIELHHLEGLSLDRTAEAMGRSFDSVAGLLRRGLEALRDRLRDEAGP